MAYGLQEAGLCNKTGFREFLEATKKRLAAQVNYNCGNQWGKGEVVVEPKGQVRAQKCLKWNIGVDTLVLKRKWAIPKAGIGASCSLWRPQILRWDNWNVQEQHLLEQWRAKNLINLIWRPGHRNRRRQRQAGEAQLLFRQHNQWCIFFHQTWFLSHQPNFFQL